MTTSRRLEGVPICFTGRSSRIGRGAAARLAGERPVAAAIRTMAHCFGGLWGLFTKAGTTGRGWLHQTDGPSGIESSA